MSADKLPESSSAGLDEYEQKYMAGGVLLGRSKIRAPTAFLLFLGLFALPLTVVAAVVNPLFLVLTILWPMIALIFSHLRVHVTSTHVQIAFGPTGPTIPIEAITSASVEHSERASAACVGEQVPRRLDLDVQHGW